MTSKTISRARTLRSDPTKPEKRLWEKIRQKQLGVRFRRQVPVGPYFADFACLDLKLIVEVDGGQHSENEKDNRRTKYLEELGFEVIRFWNNDVMDNIEGVVDTLQKVITTRKRATG